MAVSNKTKDTKDVHGAPLKREPVTFRMREDLIPLVEREAILSGQSRSVWLEGVVTKALRRGMAA